MMSLDDVQYFSADFDYEEHRRRVLAEHGESLATCTDVEPVDNGWSDAAEQSSAWSRFYDRHDTAPFFKARRYLTAEFPILMQTNGVTVLEVGCGTGSSVLPLLEANPGARVIACDFSASAVAAINRAIKKAGVPPSRFCSFVADPSSHEKPQQFADAIHDACIAAGWTQVPSIDAVLSIFVLSAVVPSREAAFIGAVATAIRPGGTLCLRDYAIGDLPMLRFAASARRLKDAPLFQRGDATLARFYDKEDLVARVMQAAADAGVGLRCSDSEYCCVQVKNRAEQLDMRRVFVHAQFVRES